MVLNASFNNISIMSWRSVLLVEEYGVPRENHQPAAQVTEFILFLTGLVWHNPMFSFLCSVLLTIVRLLFLFLPSPLQSVILRISEFEFHAGEVYSKAPM
jgi:hypothetical protein